VKNEGSLDYPSFFIFHSSFFIPLRWFILLGEAVLLIIAFVIVYYITSYRLRKSIAIKTPYPDDVSNTLRELAHEIRNPLNTMLLNLQLIEEYLEDSYEPHVILDKLGVVRAEIEQLNNFLSDFQKYAKLQKPKLEKCDIGILIEEVLDFIEPETQLQKIELIREIEHPLPHIQVDKGQFKQALLNLIINANQAMENGGKLTVNAKNLNGQVQIDVKDTGTGIPPDERDKIFKLFYTTKEEGTGLGLAITKRIVEEHGGEIKLSSALGEGTTFSIFLPLGV